MIDRNTSHLPLEERLGDLAAEAVRLARDAEATLAGVAALLPEPDRLFARRIGREIVSSATSGRLFHHRVATELETLAGVVGAVIEQGTVRDVVHETSVEFCGIGRGAWIETHRTAAAEALSEAFAPMRRLKRLVDQIRDHAAGEMALHELRRHG